MEHPLCEECLKDGRVCEAKEIHHKIPISTGKNELDMMDIAFNHDNLQALCEFHHHEIHNKMRKNH